ncbi:MAG: hypothetical protein RL220_1217 [Bacteroidota bacterium]
MRYVFIVLLVALASCADEGNSFRRPGKYKIPAGFEEPFIPSDNQPSAARIELGRRLFYDTRLSRTLETSCGTCHVQSSAFTDGQSVSTGIEGQSGKRNAPTLANLAWHPYFMMEGGVPTLELQALAPIHDTTEMGFNVLEIAKLLQKDQLLQKLSLEAYDRNIDPYVITRALACFQRSMISGDSHYDRHVSNPEKFPLSDAEQRGKDLFFSKRTACSECHRAPMFTDFGFYNVGLYKHYKDPGRERVTYLPADSGKFKTPTLRNIELTAPYMHDGSMYSLEEVIRLYSEGGENHPAKDPKIRRLNLSEQEQADLVAFLKTLTDWNFVQNKDFLPLTDD